MKLLLPMWMVSREDRPLPVQVATHCSVWVQHQTTVFLQQCSLRFPRIEKSCSTDILLIWKFLQQVWRLEQELSSVSRMQ